MELLALKEFHMIKSQALGMIIVIMVLSSLIGAGTCLGATENTFLTKEELKDDLMSGNVDSVLKSLKKIPHMKYRYDILQFLDDLWEERRKKHPDLPWALVRMEIIKITIANLLLQADVDQVYDGDREKLRRFILDRVSSQDKAVAIEAIGASLFIDDKLAVEKLLSIARKQESEFFFRASVVILAQMCTSSAMTALIQLEKEVGDSDLRSFVSEEIKAENDNKGKSAYCRFKAQQNQ